nr:MAG TPA: Terminase small subunit [Caudoviricetes sp.]
MKLNTRQKAFCEYYVACGNATESAIKAGYKEKYAGVNADKLLKNTNVSKYIKKIMEEQANNRIAKAEEILEFLTATLRGEVTEEVVVGGFGKSATEKISKNVDLKDRLKAAELLGKRYRLFTDKVEVDGVVPVMIVGESELEK